MFVIVVYKYYKFIFVKRDCNFFLFINFLVKFLERKNEFKEWYIYRKKIAIIFFIWFIVDVSYLYFNVGYLVNVGNAGR